MTGTSADFSICAEELKRALYVRLGKKDPSFRGAIIEELGVRHGKSRIDVAVLGEEILGFEIKERPRPAEEIAGASETIWGSCRQGIPCSRAEAPEGRREIHSWMVGSAPRFPYGPWPCRTG